MLCMIFGRRKNMEIYVLVPVRRSFATVFLAVLSLVLTLLSILMSCVNMVFVPLVLVFGGLWYWLTFQSNKEFEYSYFDGDARFAKVMNKSRRKALGSYTMDEVLWIAPAGNDVVRRFEEDNTVKVKDYTSHLTSDYYDMVIQRGGDTILVKFEPDDKYLDAVEIKYRQKLVRKKDEAK